MDYIYMSTAKTEFGLTPSLILELGEPDKLVPNPKFRSSSPARLFLRSRVEEFCAKNKERLDALKSEAAKRRLSASKAVETKRKKVLSFIEGVEIEFFTMPSYAKLLSEADAHAIERYGAKAHNVGFYGVCATVRHRYTNYEKILKDVEGRTGKDDAYLAIRERLDGLIEAKVEALRTASNQHNSMEKAPSH